MKNPQFIREFPTDLSGLTANQKEVLSKLAEAARLIGPIYGKQINDQFLGANFYPRDAAKEEIEIAAAKNSEILSPYTVVERSKDGGGLVAIPYHIKFKKELTPVAKLLTEAASITDNEELAKRLKFQAQALLEGSYDSSDIYWLSMRPYKIEIVIGPIERYEDKLFFTKCAYQSWVGILDEEATVDLLQFKNMIFSWKRTISSHPEKIEFLDKIQMRVDRTLIFSGLIARFAFTSTNLPNDVNLMEKHGSEVTIFRPSLDQKFEIEHFPIFHSVFEENFQKEFPPEVMWKGSLRNSFLHEIGHPITRYRDAEIRLKELFPVFDEITASVYGLKACGNLLLKDAISQKELEAIIVMFICRGFTWWLDYLESPTVVHYAQGFAIAMNYFLETGALKEANGFFWPNFTKIFIAVEELAAYLEKILSSGSYDSAKKFLEKFGTLTVFEKFMPRLSTIQHDIERTKYVMA